MIKFMLVILAFMFIFCRSFALDSHSSNLIENNESSKWGNYYLNTIHTEPHKTLILALKYFQLENNIGNAVDLGAGAGRDTIFLLKAGWQVFALDAEQLSIDVIINQIDSELLSNLKVAVVPFSEMIIPNELNLINASYSLPFCKPEDFALCWKKIMNGLIIGGRFCGQFFGVHDEWANSPNLTIHTFDDLMKLFENQFVIEYLQIENGLIPCANGELKHWHIYHIVAKKINY
ncbi:MAG: hypothetical protein Q8K60_00460 [Parachlamydiaceae bacterium]|nr:hypothetical protein [Parachlamydiaceae bacterium]